MIEHKKNEVAARKKRVSITGLNLLADERVPARDFLASLVGFKGECPRLIAECKKASPDHGLLAVDYDPLVRATSYERAGAAAVSVMTDESFFLGSLADLKSVSAHISIPVLHRDIIVDEFQIIESRAYGADSYSLNASYFDIAKLQYFIEIGRDFGMEPLVEVQSLQDLETALATDAKIIALNHYTQTTKEHFLSSLLACLDLFRMHGKGRIFVCESNVTTSAEIRTKLSEGFHAFLVGRTLMSASDPENCLRQLLI